MKKILIIFTLLMSIFLVSCTKDVGLPNLEGKNKTEIQSAFDKSDLIVSLNIIDYYDSTLNEGELGTFVKYGNDLTVGMEVSPGTIVDVYVNSRTISLPNLIGKTRAEATAIFESIGVTTQNITFRQNINVNVDPGTFINYEGKNAGQAVNPSEGITVFFDIRQKLPDLTGQNKNQITKTLNDMSLPQITFDYVVDNTKEADSFAGYGQGFEVGDGVDGNTVVPVTLYSNDNYDDYQIMFSKYVDGIGLNQAIEVFNFGETTIDLSNYYVAILSNGSSEVTHSIPLTGMLAANETFVIAQEEGTEVTSYADLITKDLLFDGNDTIQLRNKANNTYFDTIYDVGNISIILNDEIFVRRAETFTGDTIKPRRDFDLSEWAGFVPEYLEVLGSHPVVIPTHPPFELNNDIFPNFGMTKVKYLSINDGDTASFESLDPRDTASYSGDSRVRFVIVDTPEIGHDYYQAASSHTRGLLETADEIYLQADRKSGLTENYGRKLGLIWVRHGEVWTLINISLLYNGLAELGVAKTENYDKSPIFGNRYLYQWARDADLSARANKRGLYSGIYRP